MDIPGFDDLKPINRGHRYVVLRARRSSDGRQVIIKTVAPGPGATAAAAALRHEHELLRGLDLGQVARPLGWEVLGDMPVLVLADAGPGSLRDWLRHKPLDVAAFLPLAIQIAETVAQVHARDIIHRDINPANLVLDVTQQRLTLIDFDAATTPAEAGARQTSAEEDAITGTLAYLAPESSGRTDRAVDHRADLYSVGATFYEMLTGSVPFTASDPAELVHAHLARPATPPASVHPRVPEVISDLVMKLLAKVPDERYQRATTLLSDLNEAWRRCQITGTIPAFKLGRADLAQSLAIPDRVYGRENETLPLRAAFARARAGANEVVVITGPAGIGKSTFARELEPLTAQGGCFIEGKFEQMSGHRPYSALVEALRSLCRSWIADLGPAADSRRRNLTQALGRNARVMTDLVPELELFLGGQPAAVALGATESEGRFHLTFSSFVRCVAQDLPPLVLFIDDLQWADPASLKLLALLATDPDVRHLLVAVAFRNDDQSSDNAVSETLRAIRAGGGDVTSIELPGLDLAAVTAVVAASLDADPTRTSPLAQLVLQKTAGNAFFVRRFLRFLAHESLLRFVADAGRWEWDAAGIERVEIPEDVLCFMLEAIERLPAGTQRLLGMASCMRRHVEVGLLASLSGEPVAATARGLRHAVDEGLLLAAPQNGAGDALGTDARVYRFVHDRVRQAAYALLPEDARKGAHLALGRRLLASGAADQRDGGLFEAVDQLQLAVSLIGDLAGRLELAELGAQAAATATAASAHGPALGYLLGAIRVFPAEARDTNRGLLFRLHRDAAQLAHLLGKHQLADDLTDAAAAMATSIFENTELSNIRIVACSMRSEYRQAIEHGRAALALFGLEPPAPGQWEAFEAQSAARRESSRGLRPEQLLGRERMSDPRQLACMELLANLLDPAYVCDHALLAMLVGTMVELSLRHGNSVHSAFAYSVYGMIIAVRESDYECAHAWALFSVELARRFGDPVQECRTLHIVASFVNHWRAPIASSLPLLRLALTRALEGGDLHYAVYADYTIVTTDFHRGADLGQVAADLQRAFALVRKTKVTASVHYLQAYQQAVRCLQGRTDETGRFDDAEFAESRYLASCSKNPIAVWHYQTLRLQSACLFRDFAEARVLASALAPLVPVVGGVVSIVDHIFYGSLALLADLDATPETDDATRADRLAQVAKNQEQLGRYAENQVDNFRHKYQLVAAELARLAGRDSEAAAGYDQAIDGSKRGGFLQDAAFGSELAGRHHRASGRKRIGDFYLRAAMDDFASWGAIAKVGALEAEFSQLADLPWRTPLPTIGADGKALDLLSLLKAAGTISSEVVLERLLEKLLAICFEVAGATRGALLLHEEGGLVLRAWGSVGQPTTLGRAPLTSSPDVPRTLVERAHQSNEAVVLGDVAREAAFAADPYIRERQVKAALALPIVHQTRSFGVIYLENGLAMHTFTPARLKVLGLLSVQIAISLENSLLFEKLNLEIEERKRAERRAQDSIRLRDEFLSIASHELRTPVTSLMLALQVLSRDTTALNLPHLTALAKLANRQVERLSQLIENLLNVSRIQSGHLQLSLEWVDLGTLAQETIDGFRNEMVQAQCQIVLRADGPVAGFWDRLRLEQVLTNLISNALKFGRGSPIEIGVGTMADAAHLTITDHGIGIPAARMPLIFERFERGVSAANYGGLGLGLYITREIVTAMGGTITALSEPGAGATFVVTLPRSRDVQA